MAQQVPSIGRMVTFVGPNGKGVPAIITDADHEGSGEQALYVIPAMADPYYTRAPQNAEKLQGSWHWPVFVPPREEAAATGELITKVIRIEEAPATEASERELEPADASGPVESAATIEPATRPTPPPLEDGNPGPATPTPVPDPKP